MVSASDQLRVRFFSQSLTGPAFGWYTSLQPNSVRSWKQLEEQFHTQYHSEATEAGIAELAQVRQRRGETVSEYIQRFRTVKNRCYSVHLTEKEAVELAVAGLAASFKDLTFQVEYNSLAHMVQRLTLYEQRHPELYQDKFKRAISLVNADEDEDSAEDQEVAVAEWTRTAVPVSCKWVNPPGPPRGFDFDVSKAEQIFDLLLKEKQLKLPEGHKIPTAQEMNKRPYCKWHHTFTHATNDCKVLRAQIQMAIESGRLTFGQFAMKGFVGRHGEDKSEGSHSRGKDKEEAVPRDRPQDDDRRYLTEEEVRSIRYQRPLSVHLLNKYEQQYDRRRRHDEDDERNRRSDAADREVSSTTETTTSANIKGGGQMKFQCSSVWGLSHLITSKLGHLKKKTLRSQMEKKIGITDQGGALMDSAILRSVGCSGCETWKKPRHVPVHVAKSAARSGRENSANIGDRGSPTKESVATQADKSRCRDIG
ncbi:hypothetical protein QYE76_015570 [Lolium multiflorum]|uniref:Retrotransposon gag domain-containing protein n=1 Tax=Lolium multiflorum TaxID=4521 RepID=A0AAD8U6N7_LOLMU|nr:hypothetical protein QYE76_015570 [Lolium multiflorum]